MKHARDEGIEEGIKLGIEEGIKLGKKIIEQAIKQGIEPEKIVTAVKLLKQGLNIAMISIETGLSMDKIKEIEKEIDPDK